MVSWLLVISTTEVEPVKLMDPVVNETGVNAYVDAAIFTWPVAPRLTLPTLTFAVVPVVLPR